MGEKVKRDERGQGLYDFEAHLKNFGLYSQWYQVLEGF